MTVLLETEQCHRRSIRLRGYDYSRAGAYFVTVCTQGRECLFGEVVEGEMRLNEVGKIVGESWRWLATQYDYVELDEWIVMPNHLHAILVITDNGRGGSRTAPTGKRKPVGRLIGAFKTVSTRRINEHRGTAGTAVWQRNYYEHIVRDEASLNRIREYIVNNPLQWAQDRENPDPVGAGSEPAPTEPAPIRMSSPPQDEPWRV